MCFELIAGEPHVVKTSDKDRFLGRLYLVKSQGKNIGYLVFTFGFSFEYHGRDAFIDEFFIMEGLRAKGIGCRVMKFLIGEATALGFNALHLELEVDNQPARRLFDRLGFSATSRELMTKNYP